MNATDTAPDERVTLLTAGAAGVEAATNPLEGAESGPVPTAFFAFAVHVYVFEFVSDATAIGDLIPVTARVVPPSLDVQVAV